MSVNEIEEQGRATTCQILKKEFAANLKRISRGTMRYFKTTRIPFRAGFSE